MTLIDFLSLDELSRKKVIREAAYVASRQEGELDIILYKIEHFYVEAYFNNHTKTFERIKPFKTRKRLWLYFDVRLN